ncbi:MAG: hypothetical protein V4616_15255 [Bacteroidota bacterium]
MSFFEEPLLEQELSAFTSQAFLITDNLDGITSIRAFIENNPTTEITISSGVTSSQLEAFLTAYDNVSLSYDPIEAEDIESADRIAFALFSYEDVESLERYAIELRIPIEHLAVEKEQTFQIAA